MKRYAYNEYGFYQFHNYQEVLQ
jgi:histidinol-phosphatase (PHP family)